MHISSKYYVIQMILGVVNAVCALASDLLVLNRFKRVNVAHATKHMHNVPATEK